MKNSIIAGLFLLFSSVIVLLILTGGYALYMAGGLSESGIEIDGGRFFRILLASVPLLMPPALAAGFFITFLKLRHRPGFRPLTFLVLFVISAGLLWLTGTFMGSAPQPENRISRETHGEYQVETFSRLESGAVFYRDMTDPGEIRGTLIQYEEGIPREFDRIRGNLPAGMIGRQKNNNTPTLSQTAFSSENLYGSSLFSNFVLAGGSFLEWRRSGNYFIFLLAIGTFSLYLTSCWGLMQISGWPLFNALITMLILSGGGGLYRLFTADIFDALLSILEERTLGIPPVVLTMAGASILLILLDLLFIPYKKRAEEN